MSEHGGAVGGGRGRGGGGVVQSMNEQLRRLQREREREKEASPCHGGGSCRRLTGWHFQSAES